MNSDAILRGLSIAAQKWITNDQQRAIEQTGRCEQFNSGFVVCFLGKPFGWIAELGDPHAYAPGVVAVPVTTAGGFWIADGGNADAGAQEWKPFSLR